MSALPRPDLPPGPQRELVDALHDLHHRAGWPSLRSLAEAAGCSHTTVSKAFSSSRLPSWGLVELLVETMDGDGAAFRELWVAASAGGGREPGAARIAGRGAELTAVRRHLGSGSGLLVVAGEAGVGKTRLVTTAADDAGEVLVVRASCLPLATEVPLLPWAEVLEQVAAIDDGGWLKEALADSPTYVPEALGRLLPELASAAASPTEDRSWRQRLFLGVAAVVAALRGRRPWALLLEDLHWADLDTLDLLEHLTARGTALPVLGTFRLDDPNVRPAVLDWWARVGRTAQVVELGPLTREETAAQLELLTGSPPSATDVERIHARTLGLPLFTEQLAVAGTPGEQLPRRLDDLLVQRLGGLSPNGWTVAAVLGAADRDLDLDVLLPATELDADSLGRGLHELADRYLLRDGEPRPGLRHPLLAEAVRRRLLGPESVAVHRRLAAALATAGGPAAEVAEHWERAGDEAEELHWRIAAALEAADRLATEMEWRQWRRVLELWKDDAGRRGPDPGLTLAAALTRGSNSSRAAMDFEASAALAERLIQAAAGPDLALAERAAALQSAGMDLAVAGEAARGAALLEESVRIRRELEPTSAFVEVLFQLAGERGELGDPEGALDLVRESAEVAERLGDEATRRRAMAHQAFHEGLTGDHDVARALMVAATAPASPGPPYTEVNVGFMLTALTGQQNAPAADIERAGRLGLEAAERWELDDWGVHLLRSNMAEGLLDAGHVDRAAEVLDEVPDDVVAGDEDRHLLRVRIDIRRGQLDAAATRLASVLELPSSESPTYDLALAAAELEVWRGQLDPAVSRLEAFLTGDMDRDIALQMAGSLLLLAHARADLADLTGLGPESRRAAVTRLRQVAGSLLCDPFGHQISPVPRRAWQLMWTAELARLEGADTVEGWAAVAAAWDPADRPHHAAYCRWRAAQVALRQGQGTVAARLLKRAARGAREHVPLAAAISETGKRV